MVMPRKRVPNLGGTGQAPARRGGHGFPFDSRVREVPASQSPNQIRGWGPVITGVRLRLQVASLPLTETLRFVFYRKITYSRKRRLTKSHRVSYTCLSLAPSGVALYPETVHTHPSRVQWTLVPAVA